MKQDPRTLDLFGSGVEVPPEALPLPLPLPPTPPRAPRRPIEPRVEPVAGPEARPAPIEVERVGAELDPAELEEIEAHTRTRAEPRVWTVTEVNRSVKEMLEDYLPPVWISGEVANWLAHRSGHRYFTLKDETAQLRCVMWRSDARRLPIDLEDGMNVRVFGGLTLYEARGEYQLTVRQVEAKDAEGLWRLAFEKLRKKLDAEGLLDPRRKRPLPRFPRTVGIVTSTSGAALKDILSVLRRRAPWTRVVVRACRVQGEGAAAEIADAIRVLAASGRVDVMIVGRGGGSIEDLWAFNEEPVARAIADCPLPVISAVGHEVDLTIADLVADLRAPTPSAAAEAVVQDGAVLRDVLRVLPARLSRSLRGAVERRARRIAEAGRLLQRAVRGRLSPLADRIGRTEERMERALLGRLGPLGDRIRRTDDAMERALHRSVERRRHAAGSLAARLHALSPLAVLSRGYAVARAEDGRVLRTVSDFPPGTDFTLRLSDGAVRARTEES